MFNIIVEIVLRYEGKFQSPAPPNNFNPTCLSSLQRLGGHTCNISSHNNTVLYFLELNIMLWYKITVEPYCAYIPMFANFSTCTVFKGVLTTGDNSIVLSLLTHKAMLWYKTRVECYVGQLAMRIIFTLIFVKFTCAHFKGILTILAITTTLGIRREQNCGCNRCH